MGKLLIVESRIREVTKGMSISPEFFSVLSAKVAELVNESKRRAEQNGRKTLQSKDL
ncbi:MAG: DUF1931 domain-containing protein [Elusimicrobiota bacterium]